MKHTISALVTNRVGIVADVATIFRNHNINFKSISCAETEEFDVSRLVITIEGQTGGVEASIAELLKLDGVAEVDDLSRREFIDREMALLKVTYSRDTMTQIMQVLEVFQATVVSMGQETISVEITGDEDKVDGLIKMLRPHGIRSLCRTGVVALKRGDE